MVDSDLAASEKVGLSSRLALVVLVEGVEGDLAGDPAS